MKAHIRFQYGLPWADKTQPCLYRERDCITAVDRGDQTEMDHVIRVAELADAVLRENRDFKRCFATLVRAWLCPVAHITGASHDLLGAGLHPDHEHPFARYARVNLSAEDHEGKDVTELTLSEHFAVLRGIEWVEPLITTYVDRYSWIGLNIAE